MRLSILGAVVLIAGVPWSLSSQLTEDVLRQRLSMGQTEPSPSNLVQAAAAARLLGEYEQAEVLLGQGTLAVRQVQDAVISNRILLELASGGGVDGALRAFREFRNRINMTPQEIGTWVNNYPVLLSGGEFDEMIERFSLDAADPLYRCSCYAQKAWMHRVAGRIGESRMYWDSLVSGWESSPVQSGDPDFQADLQAQFARNYARAGRQDDARRKLEEAMAMPISDEAMPGVRRRWAQAYAELGDVDAAVEHLDYLLSVPSPMTVATLETRLTWTPIRDHPTFQALLDRHR
jgi:tetratricopeptide (TPR) repeat protein